jgi:hypothetical protein
LWSNRGIRQFSGEPPKTRHASFGLTTPSIGPAKPFTSGSRMVYSVLPRSMTWPLLALAPVQDFVLLCLPQCDPHLIPLGHRVHRAKLTCLSTRKRPRKAKTFCARSSPAPTQIKPQPAPTILDQELVHTTLSITHHTKERPSTGPRTLQSSPSHFLQSGVSTNQIITPIKATTTKTTMGTTTREPPLSS